MIKSVYTAFIATAMLAGSALCVHAGETPSPEGAKVYIVNLKDGDTVSSPVKVIFGLSGMGVAPAGVDKPNTGHHHILLDRPPLGEGEDGSEELNNPVGSDEHNIHYGKGTTETMLDLPAGKHTLQLVLGDMNHIPHNPPVASAVITIEVK